MNLENTKKTAIGRSAPSVPIRHLIRDNLLDYYKFSGKPLRAIDYGCGYGKDADSYNMEKYDPNFETWNTIPESDTYDIVTCTYVLNVLPMDERIKVLRDIRRILKNDGIAYITVRRDLPCVGTECKARGTKQYYVQLGWSVVYNHKNFVMYRMTKYPKTIAELDGLTK